MLASHSPEDQFQSIWEALPLPALVVAQESGLILHLNERAARELGYAATDLIGKSYESLTIFASNPAESERSLLGKNVRLLARRDGTVFHAQVRQEPLLLGGQNARLEVLTPGIASADWAGTEDMGVEFFMATLDALDSRLVVLNSRGTVVAVNRDGKEREAGEVPPLARCEVGEHYLEFCATTAVGQGIGRAVALALQQMLDGKRQAYRVSYSAEGEGRPHWFGLRATRFLERGKTWIVLSHDDVTEQVQTAGERDRFFGISLDLLCIADEAGNFSRLNPAFSTTLGYPLEELLQRPVLELVHPDDVPGTLAKMHAAAAGEGPVQYSNRYLCQDGSYKWLAWKAVVENGQTYAVARDITEIKETEGQLESTISLLQATLEATADGILVLDHQLHISDYNSKFLTMWGLPPDFLSREETDAWVLDHMREQLEKPELLVPPGSNHGGEASARGFDVLRFKDGRTLERYSQVQVMGNKTAGRVWSFRDISERKWAEVMQTRLTGQLQKERQRLKDTLANLPGIVWESWLPSPGSDDEVQVGYVSDYIRPMLGYSVQDWLTIPNFWLSIIHPEDLAQTLEENEQLMTGTAPGGVSRYRMRAANGHYIWVETHVALVRDGNGEILGLRGVSMDISDRMQAQETQNRLVALLEATTDLVGWADKNLKMRYMNRSGRSLLGIREDLQLESFMLQDLMAAGAREVLVQDGLATAATSGVWSGETAFLTRSGHEIPVSQVVMAHRDYEGEIQFYSTIARDVTEQKRVEEELRRARDELELRVIERTAELERANREYLVARDDADAANRAKSEFLSRMSHELRTPLNAILGFGQILEMQELDYRDAEAVDQILVAGRHLLELINEVLDIARIEAGRMSLSPEEILVGPMVKGVLDLLVPLASQRKVSLIDDTARAAPAAPGLEWQLVADRQRLHQVLLNLVSNAIKYNHEGGKVTLSCQEVPGPMPRLRINVADTGTGIRPEDLSKLFVPFERLGAEGSGVEGTGIGLVLARRLTEAMGGDIGVHSTPGQGSVFWVELPLLYLPATSLPESNLETVHSGILEGLQLPAKPKTVLYVEDNSSNLVLVEKLFEKFPQVTLTSSNLGRLGLQMARELKPDLVLLDLHLPDILGEEVLRGLKADPGTRDIPVLVVSADGTAGQIARLMTAGATDYLTKPLDIGQFLQVVMEVLSKDD